MAKQSPKVEKYTESLRVELTPAEIAERANTAAHRLQERDEKEADMKAASKHAKSVIEEIDAEVRRLSNEVRSRCCYRATPCERRFDFASGTVTDLRLDTGEVLHERAMRDEERQQELPLEE